MEEIKPLAAVTISPIGRKKKSNLGYTLIELLLSALIITILIGISMPLFRKQFSDLELRNSCYNVAKLLSLAQQKAIGESRFFKINLDFDNKRFWLTASDDLKEFKILKDRYGRIYSLPPGIAIKARQESFIFYPNGSSDEIDITLSSRRGSFKLTSKGGLGHIKTERIKIE